MLKLGKSGSKGIQEFSALFLKLQKPNKILCSYIFIYLHFNSEILMLFYKQESPSPQWKWICFSTLWYFSVYCETIKYKKNI